MGFDTIEQMSSVTLSLSGGAMRIDAAADAEVVGVGASIDRSVRELHVRPGGATVGSVRFGQLGQTAAAPPRPVGSAS
jgi:hypothetical protein